MIYLDNSATTKPCQAAVEAITNALTESWGNPSALYDFGIDAARQLRSARHQAAAAMGAEPDRVFFTSGGMGSLRYRKAHGQARQAHHHLCH